MGLTERHWFENEDVPENYEWALEDAVYNSHINKKEETNKELVRNSFAAQMERKMIQPNVWYNKKVTPPYGYELLLSDGVETCPGYYYNNRFYVEDIDITEEVTQWCIMEEGEIPCVN